MPPAPPRPPRSGDNAQRLGAPATNPRQRLGQLGEDCAAAFLESRGYRIVARNVRADRVEIDLIARRGRLLAIVEVKTRRSERFGSAAESVDARKQERLRRGAAAWLAGRPSQSRGVQRIRFDLVTCLWRGGGDPAGQRSARGNLGGANKNTAPEGARCLGRSETRSPWKIEHWEGAF